jgi:CBS domain-containing protein
MSNLQRRIVERSGSIVEQPIAPSNSDVARLMSPTPCCVRDDVTAGAITALLLELGFSAVPVVDADGRALGIVSKTDLLRHLHAGKSREANAKDLMMPMVFAIDLKTAPGDAAALMAGEGVHRLPVVDGSGAVVGILSALDLVRWLGQLAGYRL